MEASKLILVTDEMGKSGICGASVSWELTDEVSYEELCLALQGTWAAKCLPEPTTAASALQRTVENLYKNRSCLVKPAKNPNGTKQPAYAVLPRADEDDKMAFVESWSVGLDKDELSFSDSCPEEARQDLECLYPVARTVLGRIEQSGWLVGLVKGAMRGVPTIGGAGTFFIGPEQIDDWRALKAILSPFGVRLYEIPAMRSEQAVECVVESVKRYIQSAADDLQADLQKYQEIAQGAGEDKSKRAIQARVLTSRQAKLGEQLAIVEKYEQLFDTNLTEIREHLEKLQAGFAVLQYQEG